MGYALSPSGSIAPWILARTPRRRRRTWPCAPDLRPRPSSSGTTSSS